MFPLFLHDTESKCLIKMGILSASLAYTSPSSVLHFLAKCSKNAMPRSLFTWINSQN